MRIGGPRRIVAVEPVIEADRPEDSTPGYRDAIYIQGSCTPGPTAGGSVPWRARVTALGPTLRDRTID